MEQMLICLSLALIAGLLMSRAAKAVHLPAVTAYLLTGLLLGPFFLGRLGLSRFGFGFGSLAAVEGYGILTQVALGFIAFVIGNEFRLSALKHMGRRAVTVGVAQAVITTALVDIALVALHFSRPDVISLASAITLGSIAAATAPAATLMVVKQYKADGPLTKLLLMVVAIDDAVGLVLFSASYGVANALEQGRIDPVSVVLEPLLEIALSLALGAAAGYLLNLLEVYFHSRSKRMSLSVAFVLLTVGLSMTEFEINGTRCGFSLLLVCMMTGTVFCNVCPTSDELMDLFYSLKSPYRKKAVWVLNDSTIKAVCKLKDSTGQYLWQPSLVAGTPDTLLGRPVKTSAYMPVIAAGAKTIAFGDFSYYWIADRQGRSFKRLNELYAANGQVGFLGSQRVDGKLVLSEAVKVLAQKAGSTG